MTAGNLSIEVGYIISDIFIPLQSWFEGKSVLSRRLISKIVDYNPSNEWSAWLSIQECCLIHEVNSLN